MDQTIFSDLTNHWDELTQQGQELTFRKGQVLFYEGHTPYGVFIVRAGKVRFKKGDHPCSENHLSGSKKKQVLGLEHFFNETPSCCTCVAATDCLLTFISKTQLMPFKKNLAASS